MICEFTLPETRERVILNRKEHSIVVSVPGRGSFAFDVAGRLLTGVRHGVPFRRGFDNRLLTLDGSRAPAVGDVYRDVERVSRGAPRAAREALDPVLLCSPDRLRDESRRFAEVYGRVPVMPPDQYGALYLQATVGCPGRCTFCTLFRDRPYRVRTVGEFSAHLRDVVALVGTDVARRGSIFLGDANALAVPTDDLRSMMRLASAALPGRAFHCFADGGATLHKTPDDLRDLRALGLARVTFGLETGHPPLYRLLRKPESLDAVVESIRRVKSAGLGVGISVVAGLGGHRHYLPHLNATVRLIEALPLGAGDFIYLSPLVVDPGTEYATWAGREAMRSIDREHAAMQAVVFRCRLRRSVGRRGARIATYDLSRFTY
jgi:radical SAM superfamily enzyme YgiQ (UPF0313 family)